MYPSLNESSPSRLMDPSVIQGILIERCSAFRLFEKGVVFAFCRFEVGRMLGGFMGYEVGEGLRWRVWDFGPLWFTAQGLWKRLTVTSYGPTCRVRV